LVDTHSSYVVNLQRGAAFIAWSLLGARHGQAIKTHFFALCNLGHGSLWYMEQEMG